MKIWLKFRLMFTMKYTSECGIFVRSSKKYVFRGLGWAGDQNIIQLRFCSSALTACINVVIEKANMIDWWVKAAYIIVLEIICVWYCLPVYERWLERAVFFFNVSRKSKVVPPIQHHRLIHYNCIQKDKCSILFKVTVITCLGEML